MPDTPTVLVKPAGFRLPRTKSEWAALLLGLAAILHGLGRLLQGDADLSAWTEISAGLGTFGLPSLVKQHAHIEVVADRSMDLTELHNAAAEIRAKIGGPDDDTADLPTIRLAALQWRDDEW